MTPQEETMLGDLVRRVQSTNLTEKDPDAQNLLDQQLGGHPDALYVLAQTVLVQNYALDQAKRQMEQLKQQAAPPAPAKASSFLGSIFGHNDPPQQPAAQSYAPVQQQYAQAPPASQWSTPQGGQAYSPQAYPPQYAPQAYPPQASGGSSFLRSAATTAAGVAAGALAFEGVESLMHGFGQHAGFGGGGFGGFGGDSFGGGAPREEIVNNYYDSPGGDRGEDRYDDRGDRDNARYDSDPSSRDMPPLQDASFTGPQNDNDLEPQLDQADDVNVTDDGGSYDDASDNSGGDDSSFV
jgi:hypothetical protein